MRLAGQAKAGYYPAHPHSIELLSKHLVLQPFGANNKNNTHQILDPCAGCGLAVKQLAGLIAIPEDNVYAIELDAGRGDTLRANLPTGRVEAPASFLNMAVTYQSFGIVYVNPPFDWSGAGQREEQVFAAHAMRALITGGVMVLIMPFTAIKSNRNFCEFLDMNFEDGALWKFPDGEDDEGKAYRPYNEVAYIGRRRKQQLPGDQLKSLGDLHKMQMHWGYVDLMALPPLGGIQPKGWGGGNPSYEREPLIRLYEVQGAWKPHSFKKTKFTEDELLAELAKSPLNDTLKEVQELPVASPPLPLSQGHLGLVLASGMLDGVVEGPHGPHVVRGSSSKIKYHNVAASTHRVTNKETGAVTSREVWSERMITTIRTVDEDGKIQTYSNAPVVGAEALEREENPEEFD